MQSKEYHAVQIVSVTPTPFVTADGFQKVTVLLKNTGFHLRLWARIAVEDIAPYTAALGKIPFGKSEESILLPDTKALLKPNETATCKIELFDNELCNGIPVAVYENSRFPRTRHWTFYLSQMMHTDLGYTDYQETLRPLFTSFLNTAKGYIKDSKARGDKEPYKFAVESSWAVTESYMQEQNVAELEELANYVNKGDVAISASKFNATMENMGTEALARLAYQSKRIVPDLLHVPATDTLRMFDNPAVSKSYVDVANNAGIRYAIHSMNPDRSPYHMKKLYDIFYMTGFDPAHRLLIFNGKTYGDNYGFGGCYGKPTEGSAEVAEKRLLDLMKELEAKSGRTSYPYDRFPLPLIPFGDNKPPLDKQTKIANALNNHWEKQGFAYPKIISAFPEQFFRDVEEEYGAIIPTETGTEENWWNDGWGTTAYESGVNKKNNVNLPVAETAASLAALGGEQYPYDDLHEAWERCSVYDEHTWGFNSYRDCDEYHQQYEWKRANALGADALIEKTAKHTLLSLAGNVKSAGQNIFVYNPLNRQRTDVVTAELPENCPQYFEIYCENGSVPYEICGHTVTFVAKSVPALGYRVFSVVPAKKKPTFRGKTVCEGLTADAPFFRVTLRADGTVQSILDKRNGNRELVDNTADVRFNQYQYYDDFGIPFSNMGAKFTEKKWTRYQPTAENSTVHLVKTAYGAKLTALTGTFRAGSILQTITLYDDIPRIDIDNKVLKSPLPNLTSIEEAFYTFPFLAHNAYEIRYDLPVGNVAEGEQVYGTSTDWYTVNKWVNVYDKTDDYSMTLALKTAGLAQFGERRTGNWSFDYKSDKPYIYSYVFNNMWQTNFQGDQPGTAPFSYSVYAGKGNCAKAINQNALDALTPLQAAVVTNAGDSDKTCAETGTYIHIDKENVLLSILKPAEANGDGFIIRFNEIGGTAEKVTVKLPEAFVAYTETDIVENDIGKKHKGHVLTFELKPYEFKTFRLETAETLPAVTGVRAVCVAVNVPRGEHYQKARVKELTGDRKYRDGVVLSWQALPKARFYEIFRAKGDGEKFYLGATTHTTWFDKQMTRTLCKDYRYFVRAVSGKKGAFSEGAAATFGALPAGHIYEKPILHVLPREKNRIDLYWTPVKGTLPLSHYEIFRDGKEIAKTTDAFITTYRDKGVEFGKCYTYTVAAVDTQGARLDSETITASLTDAFLAKQDSALATTAKKRRLSRKFGK